MNWADIAIRVRALIRIWANQRMPAIPVWAARMPIRVWAKKITHTRMGSPYAYGIAHTRMGRNSETIFLRNLEHYNPNS